MNITEPLIQQLEQMNQQQENMEEILKLKKELKKKQEELSTRESIINEREQLLQIKGDRILYKNWLHSLEITFRRSIMKSILQIKKTVHILGLKRT